MEFMFVLVDKNIGRQFILRLYGILVQSILDVTDLLLVLAIFTISSISGPVVTGCLVLLKENLLVFPALCLGGTSGSGREPSLMDLAMGICSNG